MKTSKNTNTKRTHSASEPNDLVQTTVRIDQDLADRLRILAETANVSAAVLIRAAISDYIDAAISANKVTIKISPSLDDAIAMVDLPGVPSPDASGSNSASQQPQKRGRVSSGG